MLKLLFYQTDSKYQDQFILRYTRNDFQLVRLLSFCGFFIALTSRLLGSFYINKITEFPNYNEFSICNWIIIAGNLLFYLSTFVRKISIKSKRIITLLFVAFLLLSCLYISYVNSMHNTKNTLTMTLVGVFLVGIFFALEKKQVLIMFLLLFLSFWLSIVDGKISFQDKLLNACAGLTLSSVLLFISRYTYYLRSINFVRFKELEERNLEVELLNTQKNDVLGYVMHDLRAPLGNITMLNQFVRDKHPELEELKFIEKASLQANNIINDLLDAMKDNVGLLPTKSTNLVEFIGAVVAKWREANRREILFYVPVHAVFVEINAAKMERVVDNLMQNALKFSAQNTPIHISVSNEATNAIIKVTDFGIGIPEEKKEDIFKQFTTFGRSGLQGEKSIGIGLHITKKIIEQHKGTMLVESGEGQGTTFIIILPIG